MQERNDNELPRALQSVTEQNSPRRPKLLSESEDPILTNESMLRDRAPTQSPAPTDIAEPRRTKDRKDIELPQCPNCNTDRLEPSLANLRTDKVDPS